MRILIYGFGPYRQFDDNVTEKIVRALPKGRGLKKIVFPVRFNKRQFTRVLKDFRPDVVLGLGQCSRGSLLRQERRAVNRRRGSSDETPRPISAGAPAALFTNLDLKLAGGAKWSRNAGNYVCNFSMYVLLDYIRRRRLPVRYGFVHVPRGYKVKDALRLLRGALSDLGSKRSSCSSSSKGFVALREVYWQSVNRRR
jgi:pyroglutamyl-peptidase